MLKPYCFISYWQTIFVSSSGIKSTNLPVTFGVSQGLILGPLLFYYLSMTYIMLFHVPQVYLQAIHV